MPLAFRAAMILLTPLPFALLLPAASASDVEVESVVVNLIAEVEVAAEEAGPLFIPANFRGGELNTLIQQKLSGLFNGDEKFEQKFFDDLNTQLQQILDKPKP